MIGYFLSTVCDRRNYVNWSTFGSGITIEVRIIANLQQRPRARLRTARVCHRCGWESLEADTKVAQRGQFKYGPKKSLQAFPHGLQVCTFRHKLSKTAVAWWFLDNIRQPKRCGLQDSVQPVLTLSQLLHFAALPRWARRWSIHRKALES